VVPRLQEINSSLTHAIHQTVLLCKSARPATCKDVFQRLRLSDAGEWVPQDAFYEFERAKRNLPVGFDPIAKVLPELGMKYGFPVSVARQA
jgi:hypothetical protein